MLGGGTLDATWKRGRFSRTSPNRLKRTLQNKGAVVGGSTRASMFFPLAHILLEVEGVTFVCAAAPYTAVFACSAKKNTNTQNSTGTAARSILPRFVRGFKSGTNWVLYAAKADL